MLRIGVILPGVEAQARQGLSVAAAARHAEAAGLDGVWHGDHLATGAPTLDATVVLAAAAAVTTRVMVGVSVFVPAIRPLAWAAKQVASLQHVSGGRLVLGVGSGGGPAQWAAAGVPYRERGRRTDAALTLLPRLLAGERVVLPDEPGRPPVTLAPAVAPPPVWVGNASPAAIARAARFGDGWFPSMVLPEVVGAGRAEVAAAAAGHGRPVPTVCVGVAAALGRDAGIPTRAEIGAPIGRAYGIAPEVAVQLPVTGTPAEAAMRLARYAEAGATDVVAGIAAGDWRRQCDLLAETRALLDRR